MEIKFRLYQKETKEMTSWEEIQESWFGNLYSVWNKEGNISYNETTNESYIHLENEKSDKKDYIIMTSTGMKDKNGKDIYYGDIIKLPKFVQYNKIIEGEFTYEKVSYQRACTFVGDFPVFQDIYWIQENGEVVGNIYQNEDLLQLNITYVEEK